MQLHNQPPTQIYFEVGTSAKSGKRDEDRGVTNAIGVAKNALKKFANLFTVRAQKIQKLSKLREEMQNLADVLAKRGQKLFEHVSQLAKAFEIASKGKREIRKARNEAWLWVETARKKWHIKGLLFDREELYDLAHVKEKVNLAADRQGIDIYRLQMLERETTGKECFARLGSG